MEIIGSSSLWCEKYRPSCIKDLILPEKYKSMIRKIVDSGEIPNLLFSGTAGIGKSTLALALTKELNSDVLFINASVETGIDVVRHKVQQFAVTSSFMDGKKVVILDEAERLGGGNGSSAAQDALKGIIEATDKNCRYIFTTNNLSKIIDPLKSRTQLIDFSFTQTDQKEIIVQYFKRCQFILKNEGIEFDKKILADFIQRLYPDFRKIINELQKAVSMFGKIDENVSKISSDSLVDNIVDALKSKKFSEIQKAANAIDPTEFYKGFYDKIRDVLNPQSIPDVILVLGEGNYRIVNCLDREIQLIHDLVQISKVANWR